MFKRKTAEEKAAEKELLNLAQESAKAYFRAKKLPSWTAEYQTQFAVYVTGFIRSYKKNQGK